MLIVKTMGTTVILEAHVAVTSVAHNASFDLLKSNTYCPQLKFPQQLLSREANISTHWSHGSKGQPAANI